MGTTAGSGSDARTVVALGLRPGQPVQELGWDSDVDEALRQQIMDAIEGDMIEDALEAVEAVLLWWRQEDGDLADGLVDALRDLAASGCIWLLTPKVGRPGYVDPADIAEATTTAGLTLANPAKVSREWQAQKVVRPKAGRR